MNKIPRRMKYKAKMIDGKMMLTSQDIQVGDKYTQEGVDRLYPEARFICIDHSPEGDPIDDEGKCHAKAYKIMGEISPDALGYVKEGDEFDEDEWEYHTSLEDIHHSDDDNICIKGPCGHFH